MYLTTTPCIPPLVEFRSELGQQIWNENTTIKSQRMVDQYFEYEQPQLSGPASLVMLINAINVAYRIKVSNTKNRTESQRLLAEIERGNKITLTLNEMLEIQSNYLMNNASERRPLTLPQLEELGMHLGFGTFIKIAQRNEKELPEIQREKINDFVNKDPAVREIFTSADLFKRFISEKFLVRASGIIVSYDQSTLERINQEPHNVFAVIAGCHGNHVLVMGGGTKGPIWVNITQLFEAMAMIDTQSEIPMGTLSVYELM